MAFAASRTVEWEPEIDLLLSCARGQVEEGSAQRIRDLAQRGVRWPILLPLAHSQGVLPLVYRNLTAICPEAIPERVAGSFRQLARTTAAHNLFRAQELSRRHQDMEEAGVQALSFKGLILSQLAYGSITVRQFSDLDILIPAEAFCTAEEILIKSGYVPDKHLIGVRKALLLHVEREFPYVRGPRIFRVDLHTALGPRRFSSGFEFQELWERGISVAVNGTPVRSLSVPDLLLVLCHHGSRHRWEALRYICDVADLIRARQDLDWSVLVDRARQVQSKRMLLCGVYLAHMLLGSDLPHQIRKLVYRDKRLIAAAWNVLENLFDVPRDEAGFFKRMQFHLSMRNTLAAKLRYSSQALLFNSWIRARLGV